MRRYPSIIALATAVMTASALWGCAYGVTTLYDQDQTSLYSPGLVPYVTQSGQLYTIVRGNPFGTGPSNPEAIAASMRSPGWYPPFRFTTHPTIRPPTDARIVLIFNPVDRTAGGDEICEAPQRQPILPGGGPIHLQAAFCIGSRYISHIAAMGPSATGPQDPAFHTMMGQVLASLLPPISSSEIGGRLQGGYLTR